MEYKHESVLLSESVNGLNVKPGGTYLDGTLGGCGHSLEILKYLDNGLLIGIDQDEAAILNAHEKLKGFLDKTILLRGSFFDCASMLEEAGITTADGVLLDLGVSSNQLDDPERGFSYMKNGTLDMRMDKRSELTAKIAVNQYGENELYRVIKNYGEEKWAKRIAEFIVRKRKLKEIDTTHELVEIILAAIPKGAREEGQHPAKRTFQALRIEVNGELASLETALKSIAGILSPGGRLCVITFHSLEDRIVKNVFKDLANPCKCPRDFPVCACGKKPEISIITKKPIIPTECERTRNPRARSAKLRIAEKI